MLKQLAFILAGVFAAVSTLSSQAKVVVRETTDNFRIRAEKSMPQPELKAIGKMLESTYAGYRKTYAISLPGKMDVYVLRDAQSFHSLSQSKAFADGDYRNGKLYLLRATTSARKKALPNALDRIVLRAMLDRIPGCPQWLAEAYSLYAGRDLEAYGTPARTQMSSFSDLSEDYFGAESKNEVREVYAKLAFTIKYLVGKYGEETIMGMIPKFRKGGTLDEVFESTLGAKVPAIEKDWIKAMRSGKM